MRQDREHPLYHLDAETLLVAIYVWVEDVLGSSFEYVSSTGGIDGGKGSGSTATWVIEDLPPNGTAVLTLTARHVACGTLENTVRAWWAAATIRTEAPKRTIAPASRKLRPRPQPRPRSLRR